MAAAKPILYNGWISSCSHRVRIALNLKGVDYEYRAVNPGTDADYEKINPIKYIPALVDGDIVVSDSLAISLYLEDKYPQYPLVPKDLKRKALNLQIANIVSSSIQSVQGYAVVGLREGKLSQNESLQLVQHYTDKGFRGTGERQQNRLLLHQKKIGIHHHCSWSFRFRGDLWHATIRSLRIGLIRGMNQWRRTKLSDRVWRLRNVMCEATEKLLEGCESKYATGDDVQLGDVFLEPQIYAAITRFQVDMSKYPILARLHEAYMEIPAFQAALPKNQPDAPAS